MRKIIIVAYVTACVAFAWFVVPVPHPSHAQSNVVDVIGNASELSPGTVTGSSITSTTSGFVTLSGTSSTIGNVVTLSSGTSVISLAIPPTPQLAINCSDDTCTVNVRNIEQAKALLERIANRSVTMDVVYDQNCHPQHEIIAAKPDLVASLPADVH